MSRAGVERVLAHKIGGLKGYTIGTRSFGETPCPSWRRLFGEIVKMKPGDLDVDIPVKALLRYFFNGAD
jgi:hypothetical protein